LSFFRQKADEIDEELEAMGASIESGMDVEYAAVSAFALKKDKDHVINLLFEILKNPKFEKEKLELEKGKMIEGIRRRNDEPFQIARREYRKLVYGPDHPLSRTKEIPILKSIKRQDLIKFHKKYYHPNNMKIAVSGDINPDEIAKKIDGLLKKWPRKEIIYPKVREVKESEISKAFSGESRDIGWAEKSLKQTSLIMGHFGIKRHDPNYLFLFGLTVIKENQIPPFHEFKIISCLIVPYTVPCCLFIFEKILPGIGFRFRFYQPIASTHYFLMVMSNFLIRP